MAPSEIMTDAGRGYIKALGNPQGPHGLACEWIGTQLAGWFGLPTFDIAIMQVLADDDIPLGRNCKAEPGPALVTRAEEGRSWGGSEQELEAVENTDQIAALVVFDTWVRNCDRFPPDLATRDPNYDNVFLSAVGKGRSLLKAIDHNNAFSCGHDLDLSIKHIGKTNDPRPYGLFPAFSRYLTRAKLASAMLRLGDVSADELRPFIDSIPKEWEVPKPIGAALIDFLVDRAKFLQRTTIAWPLPETGSAQQSLFSGECNA